MMNQLRAFFFLVGIPLFMILIGDLLGHEIGVFIALFFTILMYFSAYSADKVVINLYGAKETKLDDLPALKTILTNLAQKSQLPMPTLYLIKEDAPNLLTVGHTEKNAKLLITTGLLNTLNEDELKAAIAHEMSHIKHQDTLIATICAAIAGFFTGLANTSIWKKFFNEKAKVEDHINPILMRIFAPIAALLIKISISAEKEFQADAEGAKLSENPTALASALKKMEVSKSKMPFSKAQMLPATAHLFFINPLEQKSLLSWFHKQPETGERIRRLKNL